jgi:U4/U6.U5 tri-snRNP-associated protein 1
VLTAEVLILDVKFDVGVGVAGALRLAVSSSYPEHKGMNKPSASRFALLQAQNCSIEEQGWQERKSECYSSGVHADTQNSR